MKSASVAEIKQELQALPKEELLALCLRLVKYKKDNKELLSFQLFHSHDLEGYIAELKEQMDAEFSAVSLSSIYFAKKTVRKILKDTSKHFRYAGSPQLEAELLIYFCQLLHETGWLRYRATALSNLYNQQVKKLNTVVGKMHEDLQYDYQKQINDLPTMMD